MPRAAQMSLLSLTPPSSHTSPARQGVRYKLSVSRHANSSLIICSIDVATCGQQSSLLMNGQTQQTSCWFNSCDTVQNLRDGVNLDGELGLWSKILGFTAKSVKVQRECHSSHAFVPNMSFPAVHSHTFTQGPLPQLRRKVVTHCQASLHQRSRAPQQSLSSCKTFCGQQLSCHQLPARARRVALHAVARQGGDNKREEASDGFQERVVQVRRVTKVVKGGKQLSFRYCCLEVLQGVVMRDA